MFTAVIGTLDLGQFHTDAAAYAEIGRYVTAHPDEAHRQARVTAENGETPARMWRMPELPDPEVTTLYPVNPDPHPTSVKRWDRFTEDPRMWRRTPGRGSLYSWDELLSESPAVTDRPPARAGLAPGLWTARLPIALGGRVEPGADIAAGEQIVLLEPGGGDTWHVMTINGDRARAATRVLEGALLEGGAQS